MVSYGGECDGDHSPPYVGHVGFGLPMLYFWPGHLVEILPYCG